MKSDEEIKKLAKLAIDNSITDKSLDHKKEELTNTVAKALFSYSRLQQEFIALYPEIKLKAIFYDNVHQIWTAQTEGKRQYGAKDFPSLLELLGAATEAMDL